MWHELFPYLSKHETLVGAGLVFLIGVWTQVMAVVNFQETRTARRNKERAEAAKLAAEAEQSARETGEQERLITGAINTHVRYDLLMDICPVAIIAASADGRITDWTEAACALLGWTSHEAKGRPLTIIIPPELRGEHLASFRRYLDTGESRILGRAVPLKALHKDGRILEVTLCAGAGVETDGSAFFAGFLFATPPPLVD